MLRGGCWNGLCSQTLHVRDHRALCRSWLVEGLMYKAVQEEEHDEDPTREEL